MIKVKNRKILFLFLLASLVAGSTSAVSFLETTWLARMVILTISQQIGAAIIYLSCFGPTNQFK